MKNRVKKEKDVAKEVHEIWLWMAILAGLITWLAHWVDKIDTRVLNMELAMDVNGAMNKEVSGEHFNSLEEDKVK